MLLKLCAIISLQRKVSYSMKTKLTVPRQKKLRKLFPDGEAVGRAFVQFYIEQQKSYQEPNFNTTLSAEEINFLRSSLHMHSDTITFKSYNVLEQILRQFTHWIEHFQHIFYHGLYRDIVVIQISNHDLQNFSFLTSQQKNDQNAIDEAINTCNQSLKQVVDILIPNWNDLIAFALKKLYSYSIRLEKIQELTLFDLSPLLPDVKHHEWEVNELRDLANNLTENLENNANTNLFRYKNEALKTLHEFIQIDIKNLQPNEEERADDIQKGIEAVEVTKIVKQQYS